MLDELKTIADEQMKSIQMTEELKRRIVEFSLENMPLKKQKKGYSKMSIVTICTILLFILSINISAPLAEALGEVPLLKEVISWVRFDKGLSAAVDYDYFQPIGVAQEIDGIRLNVDGIMADDKKLIIFLGSSYTEDRNLDIIENISFYKEDGSKLEAHITTQSFEGEMEYEKWNDGRRIEVFMPEEEGILPHRVKMVIHAADYGLLPSEAEWATEIIKDYREENLYEEKAHKIVGPFEFEIVIDKTKIAGKKVYEIHKSLELEPGLEVELGKMEVYPLHATIEIKSKKEKKLRNLSIVVTNEKGEIWHSKGGAHINEGDFTLLMESTFFSQSKNLRVSVDRYSVIPEEKEFIIDVVNGKPTDLYHGQIIGEKVVYGKNYTSVYYKTIMTNKENQIFSPFSGIVGDANGDREISEIQSSTIRLKEREQIHEITIYDKNLQFPIRVRPGIMPPKYVVTESIRIK